MYLSATHKRRLVSLTALVSVVGLLTACTITNQPMAAAANNAASSATSATPKRWQAMSTTAISITGDISLSDHAITFANGESLALELVEKDQQTGQTLFRVATKANPELLNGNRICGGQPIDYLLEQQSGEAAGQSEMQLMAYYYPEELRLNDLPLKDPNDIKRMMCALYTYVSPTE